MEDIEGSTLYKALCSSERIMAAITKDQLLLELVMVQANYPPEQDQLFSFRTNVTDLVKAFYWAATPQGREFWDRLCDLQNGY